MSLSLAGLDPSLLNFAANCNITGEYFATSTIGKDKNLTTEYFRQALPAEYRDNFTFDDIENYILPLGKRVQEAESRAKGVCWFQICEVAYRAGNFRGNPDITGIGMLVSYAIQCFLFTMFSFANFIYNCARIKRAGPKAWWPERATKNVLRFGGLIDPEKLRGPMKMVREAQLVFLDSSILFALSVAVAAYASQERQQTVYEVAFTCFVSGYVAMPLIPCLHDLWESEVYRRPLRVMFTLVAFVLGISGGVFMVWKDANMRFVDTDCPIIEFASFRMVFTGSMVVTIGAVRFVVSFLKVPEWLETLRRAFPRINSVITSALMISSVLLSACCWGLYVMFLAFTWKDRTKVGNIIGSDNFEDGRMGFGQVVSLWLWIPALTEFFTLWFAGIEDGLSGRVLGGGKYVVTDGGGGGGSAGRSRSDSYTTIADETHEMPRRRRNHTFPREMRDGDSTSFHVFG